MKSESLDTTTILQRSVQGIVSLTSRSLFTQLVNNVSFFVLAAFLDMSALGVFYIVSAVIAVLTYFSDIGLAASLVQKKEVTKEDFKTTFTIQQILILLLVAGALMASPLLALFYRLDQPGIFLYQALVVSFFFSSLKTIPSVILERRLDFKRLVLPQIAETVVFNAVAVTLASFGLGVTSFTIAVLARGLVGVIVMYIVVPWKPAFGIAKDSAKRLLSFGFPFQTNSVLALLKDDLLIIVLGALLGRGEMGFVGFSQKVAYAPLRFAMDNVIRIMFPLFSRLQGEKKSLPVALEKSLFTITSFVTPLLVGLVIIFPYLIHLIPRYAKFEPAFISVVFFAGNALLSSISTPLTNFLNAIGKIKVTLVLMVFWTTATWVATLVGVQWFGFNGVAIAAFMVSLSVIYVVSLAKKHVDLSITKAVGAPLLAGVFMGVPLFFAAPYVGGNLVIVVLASILAGACYFLVLYLLAKQELRSDLLLIKSVLQKRDEKTTENLGK